MSEKLPDSYMLLDAKSRLVDWDEGFEHEFRFAAHLLKPGAGYAEILRAAVDHPLGKQFLRANAEITDIDSLIRDRLEGLGSHRAREYRTSEGRVIRVDEHRTRPGGIRRFARDITDERNALGALADAQCRLDAVNSDTYGVLSESRRTSDGNYIFEPISEGLVRLLDLPTELVGKDPMLIYSRFEASPEDNARVAATMEHSAATLESFSHEYRIRDGKDRLRWIRQSMIPRREADGTVIFSGVMRDVTREKEAEDQVELLRSVVVQFTDSILIFEVAPAPEPVTKILYVNAKFTELFGPSAEILLGRPTQVLIPNDVNGVGADLFATAIRRGDGVPFEHQATGKDGRIFWVEVRVVTVQKLDNGGFRRVVISRDISERRHVQDELLRAKDEAEAGNRAKGQFLTHMSHELRTPLNAIIGFTELIEQSVARTGWIASYSEYLADVSASGRHLLDLINTILDLSKIESGQLKLEAGFVDLCALARTSLALVSGMAREGQIIVSADITGNHPDIPGDYLKLKQVLLNIVSNAIKFTPAGGRIDVGVAFTATQAVVTVADTGCGIAAADIGRVTLPFVQVGNTLSRKYEGSGLGLSIAQELCSLHGGKLTIASVEGEGTTVTISLPLTARAMLPLLPMWPVPAAGTRDRSSGLSHGDRRVPVLAA